MSEAGLLPLMLRMVVSLGAVLAVIVVAYTIARRRVGGGSRAPRSRAHRRTVTPPIEVVGRAGLTKGSVAVALRFGERVVLVGVSEQAPTTVLQEMDASLWDAWNETATPIDTGSTTDHTSVFSPNGAAAPESIVGGRPPSLIDALREATTRRV
jgi:flagellar biogenesis protein FliO